MGSFLLNPQKIQRIQDQMKRFQILHPFIMLKNLYLTVFKTSKKHKMKQLLLTCLFFSVILPKSFSITILNGALNNGTYGGTVLINKDATVYRDSTLRFLPGTIVKMGIDVQLSVLGYIEANGTAENPVIFTSINDNSMGESVASATSTPTPGDWNTISINGLGAKIGTGKLTHTVFRYGGGKRDIAQDAMVTFFQTSYGVINNCLFEKSSCSGLHGYSS